MARDARLKQLTRVHNGLERFPVHGPQVNASSLLSVKRVLIGENTFTGGDSIHQGSFSRQLREVGSSNWFECGIRYQLGVPITAVFGGKEASAVNRGPR